MGHNCGHHHGGTVHSASSDDIRRLTLVLWLTAAYMVIEFVGGWWANSLALLADAGHMLTDVGAVGLALFAAWFSQKKPSPEKTFGYYRLEIFAAFLNGLFLLLISIYIGYEAWIRMSQPFEVQGKELMLIAAGGFLINMISAGILLAIR